MPGKVYSNSRVVEAAEYLLRPGKSLCLVGPPGSGKTRLAVALTEERGLGYELVTGRESLTYEQLVGLGGPVSRSVLRTWARYTCGLSPVWLIFDEVNRARVEVVLGEVFTLLDVDHRVRFRRFLAGGEALRRALLEAVEAECGGVNEAAEKLAEHASRHGLPMPLSWRMIATMNLFDMSHLYRIGYAFARRAPLLPVTGEEHYVEPLEVREAGLSGRQLEACREAVRTLFTELPRVVRSEPPWKLLPEEVVARFEAPLAPLDYDAIVGKVARKSPFWGVISEIASHFERLGLLVGLGLYIDACKLLAANISVDHMVLADVFVASLLAPQLSFLASRLRLEAALGSTKTLEKLQELLKIIEKLLGEKSLSYWAARAYLAPVAPLEALSP